MKLIIYNIWILFAIITGLSSLLSWLRIEPDDVKYTVIKLVLERLNTFSDYKTCLLYTSDAADE